MMVFDMYWYLIGTRVINGAVMETEYLCEAFYIFNGLVSNQLLD